MMKVIFECKYIKKTHLFIVLALRLTVVSQKTHTLMKCFCVNKELGTVWWQVGGPALGHTYKMGQIVVEARHGGFRYMWGMA